MRPKLSFANVVSVLALFVALGGSAYAFHLGKNSVGPKQLKKNAVTTAKVKKEAITAAKVKKGTLTGAQINVSTLGIVPAANTADTAERANSLAAPEGFHEVGAAGEPLFQNSWRSTTTGNAIPKSAGFYKDHDGIVHLEGAASDGTDTTIFQLPPGFRPANNQLLTFVVPCANCPNSMGLLQIYGPGYLPGTEGAVWNVTGTATTVNLDGITFRAES